MCAHIKNLCNHPFTVSYIFKQAPEGIDGPDSMVGIGTFRHFCKSNNHKHDNYYQPQNNIRIADNPQIVGTDGCLLSFPQGGKNQVACCIPFIRFQCSQNKIGSHEHSQQRSHRIE